MLNNDNNILLLIMIYLCLYSWGEINDGTHKWEGVQSVNAGKAAQMGLKIHDIWRIFVVFQCYE